MGGGVGYQGLAFEDEEGQPRWSGRFLKVLGSFPGEAKDGSLELVFL